MRILINSLSARNGGGQTYLLNLLPFLGLEENIEAFILASDSFDVPEIKNLTKIRTSWPTENPLLRTIWEKLFLPKILSDLKIDVLFCPGGVIVSNLNNCRTATMFRNMIPFDQAIRSRYPLGLTRLRNWILERAMLKSMIGADLVIFISDFARGVIEKRAGKQLKHAVTIPHGLTDRFKADADKTPLRPEWLPEGEYLLYVSIFDVYKSQLEVVQGFHLLKQLRNTPEKLILAGHNSNPCGDNVREEIARLGLENEVILTGKIPYQELPNVYFHAKINLFASECENCPNILLEALGAGRPLLVSNRQPMPEFGGEAVIYFDPSSPRDFAEKISSFIDDQSKMDALALKARERALIYDWKETARQTWASLKKLSVRTNKN